MDFLSGMEEQENLTAALRDNPAQSKAAAQAPGAEDQIAVAEQGPELLRQGDEVRKAVEGLWQEWTSGMASVAAKAAGAVREEYTLTFEHHGCNVRAVRPNLLAIEYPTRGMQHWLASRLNRDHPGGRYLVVNLSGQTYDTVELQGPVMDVVMSGCVPPVDVLARLCVSAHKWLSSSDSNVLVAHGASYKAEEGDAKAFGLVVLLFACYLSWSGLAAHPKEGMLEVCEALQIGDECLLPSQRRYLSYFELLQRDCVRTAQEAPVRLGRLVLIDVGIDGKRRAVEVWHQDHLVFRSVAGGDEDATEADEGSTIAFRVGKTCRGDLLVRVLRETVPVGPEGERAQYEAEVQVCFHTAFISAAGGFMRFPARELDVLSTAGGDVLAPRAAVDVFLESASAAEEPDDLRELAAAAAAGAAAAEGPKAGPQVFDLAEADAEEAEEAPGDGTADTRLGLASGRIVFAPEDVDAFFDEL
mmetsp:Transcript_25153/g.63804  ORF Transcript_25153/g.63804 Transcript_25153/m.63804 type:complete len:472 (-) Transcript_25153:90-1505(-)